MPLLRITEKKKTSSSHQPDLICYRISTFKLSIFDFNVVKSGGRQNLIQSINNMLQNKFRIFIGHIVGHICFVVNESIMGVTSNNNI